MKEIVLGDSTPVSVLSELLHVPPTRVIEVGFNTLGLLLTIADVLPFERAKAVADELGYTVRRRSGGDQ
jgi:hypothetical protein